MKLTITIEDLPGGGVLISGDPSLDDLCERAKKPKTLTSAEGYAMQAWITLQLKAAIAAKDPACKDVRWMH